MKDYKSMDDKTVVAKETARILKDMTGAEIKEFFISVLKTAIDKGSIDEKGDILLSLDIFKGVCEKSDIFHKRVVGF